MKVTTKYVEIKCQLDATEVFIADLIACATCFGHQYAHHQELKSIIQWLLPVVFRGVVFKLLVWCGADYCLFIKYYSPVHVSSIKCSSSGGHSCIHATYGTVTLYKSPGGL